MLTKEDILKEIRRTAKENGGVPLGKARFETTTEITEWDWIKYWARFGDAQKEAGFEANKLQTAYSDSYIFEKFIELTRELGKFPAKGDFLVKHHADHNFPTRNVFSRLGTKQNFLSKVLIYATDKKYEDIVELCKTEFKKSNSIDLTEDISEQEAIGSVYLAKSGRYYKIGRTNSMGRRHHEITILLPENFELIHEIKTDDPSGIETYWHRRFTLQRKNGEWFDLNSSQVKAFKRWKRII